MTRSRRWLCAAVPAALLVHGSLAAQAATVRQSASFDLAALVDGEIRVLLEPVIVGRTAFGVSLARWWGGGYAGVTPLAASSELVAPGGVDQFGHPAREYMLDVYARVYPTSFSSANPKHRVSGYLGGFLGLHRREHDLSFSPCPPPLDPTYPCPLIESPAGWAQSTGARAVRSGVEPGAEVGIRVMPLDYLFLEIGVWARLITFSDPKGRYEDGQVDSRLTFAVGVSW